MSRQEARRLRPDDDEYIRPLTSRDMPIMLGDDYIQPRVKNRFTKAKLRVELPRKVKQDIIKAHRNVCSRCDEPRKRLQIHHIDGNHSNNNIENLRVLCYECHLAMHSGDEYDD